MAKMTNYMKMSIEAKEIQQVLRDEFNFHCQDGYCVKHKCSIEESIDGSAICPVFEKKASELWEKTPVEQDTFYSKEDCSYGEYWVGFPDLEQLFNLMRDKYDFNWLILMNFAYFIEENAIEDFLYPVEEKSVQELLLIFVMKRKYKKIWDRKKEKWIKEKSDDK